LDADARLGGIGVGDLVRFRLRGGAAVDEYGVVVHVSHRRRNGDIAGAHIQARSL
jgi:hypothetical protein